MASSNDAKRKYFGWTDQSVLILCGLLNKYVMKYGRSIPFKWMDLQPEFENIVQIKLYSEKVLKHKYDEMRKDYNLWKSLKNKATGVGWNQSLGKLDFSDDWWDKRIKEDINVKRIRRKQPSVELQEAWDQLFTNAVANGIDCV
ncbi:uncharacterized protein [Rutidosis leptorrhynchoides]|uniref:uncharacterized protein n=1 Tax=Rutidosis leptorrhynchoides TaxID=125765 RepID=UPI003A99FD69